MAKRQASHGGLPRVLKCGSHRNLWLTWVQIMAYFWNKFPGGWGGEGESPPWSHFFLIFLQFEVMFIKDELIMPSRLFMLALFFSSVVYLFLYLVLPPQLYFAPGILIMFLLQMLNHSMDCASLRTRSRSRSCRVQYLTWDILAI